MRRSWAAVTVGALVLVVASISYFLIRSTSERASGSQGYTVWALFRSDTKYFAPSEAPFMINYRVRNLDRMLAQLRANGVTVEAKISEEFNGRFAWIVDPEGNKVELWEPKEGN